jgi:hypothetical protein
VASRKVRLEGNCGRILVTALYGTWCQPRFAWQKVQPLDVINFLFRQLVQFSLPGGWAKGKKQHI